MSLLWIVVIVLLLGGGGIWYGGYGQVWGGPGIIGIVLLVVVVFALTGRL